MAQKKTTNLLPGKFRTSANSKFLNTVLEPLISEPELRRLDGFVGRRTTSAFKVADGYLQEDNASRQQYQLEPTLITRNAKTDRISSTLGYPDFLNKLRYLGNSVTNQSLLFEQEYYNFKNYVDVDKLINYSQYYWTSYGLTSVLITSTSTVNVEQDIIGKLSYTSTNGVVFTNGLKIKFATYTEPQSYQNKEYIVEQVGIGIKLVDVTLLFDDYAALNPVPYDTVGYDISKFDTDVSSSLASTPMYFVINRSDSSVNSWARSNKWVHIDVIRATANYNRLTVDLSKYTRAARPIIEFHPNIALFNHGTTYYGTVNVFDTVTTDPLSDDSYRGTQNSTVLRLADGTTVKTGDKVIFTNATDLSVRNKIYTVRIGNFTGVSPPVNRISLTPTSATLSDNASLIVKKISSAAVTYVYKNQKWSLAQQRAGTGFAQAPLFDLFDENGNSYADTDFYPTSTFTGTYLFNYKQGTTGVTDTVLNFKLSYRSIGNTGDIQFQNYISTSAIPNGLLKTNNVLASCWEKIQYSSYQRQLFEFTADSDTQTFMLDISPISGINSIDVNVNGKFLNRSDFNYNLSTKVVSFDYVLATDSFVTIMVNSNEVSAIGYYEIPVNLNNNSDNQEIEYATLGQLRNHAAEQYRNASGIATGFPGLISVRDTPIGSYQGTMLQHSAPLLPAMFFLTNDSFDFIASLDLARSTYSFFKKQFLDAIDIVPGLDFDDVPSSVDAIMEYLTENKSPDMPYYYSDMIPYGENVTVIKYTITGRGQLIYGINSYFDDTVLSSRAVLVYYNPTPSNGTATTQQLTRGKDYVFSKTSPSIELLFTPVASSTLEIRDYESTNGCYVPETPTKMGMWPATRPEITIDYGYLTARTVVIGHDGSRSIAFDDIKDKFLLELELRIYNNIKRSYDSTRLNYNTVVPGGFRTTGYTLRQVDQILSPYYYKWSNENGLSDLFVNMFKNSDPWSWNYYNQVAKNDTRLTGSWYSVFQYWYDTVAPDSRPWEMLGYTYMPSWWTTKYGPAPYTSGNTILWNDIRDGVQTANDGVTTTINLAYARPSIYSYLPVDSYGQRRTPLEIFVKIFNGSITNTNYSFGMCDPVELSWRRSSDFAFAAQAVMAVLKPAKYFALMA